MSSRFIDFSGLFDLVSLSQIENDPKYKEAAVFKETIEPSNDVDYEWVCEYARDCYDRSEKIFAVLDGKANDIIKYLGGGAGLFTLAVLTNLKPENARIVIWTIPAYLISIMAIYFAVKAKQPNSVALPPSVKSAFDYANRFEGTSQASFLGQWNMMCVGMSVANQVKARSVRKATWAFFGAIVALIFPLGAAIWR
ncbi:hypothetical protein SAMN05444166_0158 [Singulisphaera sp. GP187]|uniref:hypothetical protein n=1 Tax=Singulisphaera sp. GP187 TaxID=1882752 RepID=UPI000928053D|nr:hypothetical protein [Singulisphaera sp. GP187]SIN69218.1 hypothetical protein SAMN05444166_0158 [Singulisphaera sp. GP187]